MEQNEMETALKPEIQPVVTILWSENKHFYEGQQMPLYKAEALFGSLDAQRVKEQHGYDKTKFKIDYVFQGKKGSYEGRQDLGDGDGSLTEHIEKFYRYYLNDPDSSYHQLLKETEGKKALEDFTESCKWVVNEFVPYLRYHCRISELEMTAQIGLENLNKAENPSYMQEKQILYYKEILKIVQEDRHMVNNAAEAYTLKEVPSFSEFVDRSEKEEIQEYKKAVQKEMEQEARNAAMTMEEYAANGYEPYPVVEVKSAVHSNYAGMVALFGKDNKVYLGKKENYDGCGHYDNRDSSLCFISDNENMYDYLYATGYRKSQAQMIHRGLRLTDYEEFARLQEGVLSRFEKTRDIMFDGRPFVPPSSIREEINYELEHGKELTIKECAMELKELDKAEEELSIMQKIKETKKKVEKRKETLAQTPQKKHQTIKLDKGRE